MIAIIALLMALLLPAIQKVREAANKMLCASNMRQIMIAAHNYHNDYQRLPAGTYGPLPTNTNASPNSTPVLATANGPHLGMLAILLPYMEADNIYKVMFGNVPSGDPLVLDLKQMGQAWYFIPACVTAGSARIKGFVCPSDDAQDAIGVGYPAFSTTSNVALATNHTHRTGSQLDPLSYGLQDTAVGSTTTASVAALGITNYVGSAGAMGLGTSPASPYLTPFFGATASWGTFVGVFTNRSTLTLGQLTVQDGTTNTVGLIEGMGGNYQGQRSFRYAWIGIGCAGMVLGIAKGNDSSDALSGARPLLNTPLHPSSRHAAGINACFCDGSVRTVKYGNTNLCTGPISAPYVPTADWALWMQIVGRRDGFNLDASSILD